MSTLLRNMLVAGLACAGTTAQASPGEHVRFGPALFVPILETGFEYHSNAYLAPGVAQTGREFDAIQSGVAFYLSPQARLDVETPQFLMEFEGKYFMRKQMLRGMNNLDRFQDGQGKLNVELWRRSVVGLSIRDRLASATQPDHRPELQSSLLRQLRNELNAVANFRIGGELFIDVGGGYAYHNYRVPGIEVIEGQEDNVFNWRNTYDVQSKIEWRFFPRTALVFEGRYEWNRWDQNVKATGLTEAPPDGRYHLGAYLVLPDSQFWKATVGLRGRVTRSLVIQADIGYGMGLYDYTAVLDQVPDIIENPTGTEFDCSAVGCDQDVKGVDGILASVQAKYDWGYNDKRRFGQLFTVQYRRNFADSYFTNYLAWDFVRGRIDSMWHPKITTYLDFTARFEKYRGEVDRDDTYLWTRLGLDYQTTPWAKLGLLGGWVQRASSQPTIQYDDFFIRLIAEFQY